MRSVTGAWTGLLNGDNGSAIELADYPDRSFQIEGTAGAGLSVSIQGSNDGTNWVILTDPQGNALTFTAIDRIEQVEEVCRYMRPIVTAGDGTTNLVVTMFGRRS